MGEILSFVGTYWLYTVPLIIGLILYRFIAASRRAFRPFYSIGSMQDLDRYERNELIYHGVSHSKDRSSPIADLFEKEDFDLRIVEEVYQSEPSSPFYRRQWRTPETKRLHILEVIANDIRAHLRASVKSENFKAISGKALALLDQIRTEVEEIEAKEPFSEILDPEKSLIIDIFNGLDEGDVVIRQKTHQLANIIKIKHQDFLKLQADNVKAASWTKWGTSGTIFFGIISLVLSIITILDGKPG